MVDKSKFLKELGLEDINQGEIGKISSINDASKKISALEAIYNAPARLRIEMF